MEFLPLPHPGADIEPAEFAASFATARFFPVVGDYMEPLFQSNGLAAVAPASGYCGEGVYVLDVGLGPVLYCAEHEANSPEIIMRHADPRYWTYRVPIDQFNASVLGKVFVSVRVIDRTLLRKCQQAAR